MKWGLKGGRGVHFSSGSAAACYPRMFDEIQRSGTTNPSLHLLRPWRTGASSPIPATLASLLRASSGSFWAYEHGEQLHSLCVKIGCSSNTLVANALIAMYSKSGCIEAAESIFLKMADKDIVTHNTMVSAYEQNNKHSEAIGFFHTMCLAGYRFDEFSLSSALRSCTSIRALGLGQAIHAYSLKLSCLPNLYIGSAVLKLYCECGNVEDALLMFAEMPERDVICWNSIICGFVQNCRDKEAIRFFKDMQTVGERADAYMLASLISSEHCLENMYAGQQLHAYAVNTGIILSLSVGNALIAMYGRSGRLSESNMVFQTMTGKNIVSWTAMISVCAQQKLAEQALLLFSEMMKVGIGGVRPNWVTFVSVLNCCGNLASLLQGNIVLSLVLKLGFASRVHVQNSILSFFAECGCMGDAEATFMTITDPDIVSWNSLISGYSKQGRGNEALVIFEKMQKNGMIPDSVTFISLLSACRHAGLLHEGLMLLEMMICRYGIEPRTEHLVCMVDLLARTGRFDLAEKLIRQIDVEHRDASAWRTVLGACWLHGNSEFASLAAEKVLEVESHKSEAYIVLSNIYATSGRWDMVGKFRHLMKHNNVIKEPGFSWIQVVNRVHFFVSASPSHPKIDEIYATLIALSNNMKHYGE